MTIRPKSVLTGAAALAVAAGLLAGTGGAALAAAPPWEPDPSSIGGLTFYDAAGNQITGGNVTDAPFATYVAGRRRRPRRRHQGHAVRLPAQERRRRSARGPVRRSAARPSYPNASAPGAAELLDAAAGHADRR